MKYLRVSENKIFTIYIVTFLLVIYGGMLITLPFAHLGNIIFFNLGVLTLPSLVLFLGICVLAVWKRNFYFLFLIFVILAFPAPIDDLFPSVRVTNIDDQDQVFFPLITRIDLYLILGILLKLTGSSSRLRVVKFTLPLKILLIFLLFTFVAHIFNALDLWDVNILLAYTFHVRYLILFLILVQQYNLKKYQKQIVFSFVISLLFLLIEAYINSSMRGASRLISGSLSLNTFANIAAAIALYMIVLMRYHKVPRMTGLFAIGVALVIIIASETRGAILTLILAYFSVYLLSNHKKIVVNSLKVVSGVFLLGIVYIIASNNNYIPERYSYREISDKIEINFSENSLNKIIKVKWTEQTSSIRSRIDFFDASLNMIVENPSVGIGAGRWNRHKNLYSEDNKIPKVLLDTHNDYLALMSQYGIVLGLLFAWTVFFYPFQPFAKIKKKTDSPLSHLYVINFAMSIAALSNAGFFKHQVSALLLFCLCITIKLRYEPNNP
ncbi:MAG: O-antigen ligase family protein [Saonia sp.]